MQTLKTTARKAKPRCQSGPRHRLAQLEKTEGAYHKLFQKSLQGLAVIQDGRIVLANRAFCRMLGYSAKELLGFSPRQTMATVHPSDQAECRRRFADRLACKPTPGRYVMRLLARSGRVLWVEVFGSRIEYRGRPAVQAAYVDITDLIRAETALRESMENFRALAENANEAILIADADGRHVFANRSACRLTGRTRAELLGTKMSDLIAPRDRRRVARISRRRLAGKELRPPYEMLIVHKRGDLMPVEVTGAATRWRGRPATIGMSLSKPLLKICGLPDRPFHDGIEDLIRSVVRTDDRAMVRDAWKRALRKPTGEMFVFRICRKDGTVRTLQTRTEALRDDRGRKTALLGSAQDITERRTLAQQVLRVSSQEKQSLGQTLHDSLGQQLTGIAFMAKGRERQLSALGLAEAGQAQRILELTKTALDQSREISHGLAPVDVASQGLASALSRLG